VRYAYKVLGAVFLLNMMTVLRIGNEWGDHTGPVQCETRDAAAGRVVKRT
jgi:hypothetical protein